MESSTWELQVYISSTWVDLSPDVRTSSPFTGSRGIMGNGPLDRVAGPGFLNFALDNSADNSAGLAGYYSPGHTNCMTGWTTGLKVRFIVHYDGKTFYKWYGRIKPDGLTVSPGAYGPRDCQVSCYDWMGIAQAHEMMGIAYATTKRIDEAIPLIHANMPFSPLATDLSTGVDTFPTVFDITKTKTTAWNEYNKLALSEWSYIYVKGDTSGGETLVSEARGERNSVTVPVIPLASADSHMITDESGTVITDEDGVEIITDETQSFDLTGCISEGMQVSYGKNVTNRVSTNAYPRVVDAAATTVLASLKKSFFIASGTTVSGYRMSYRDPANPSVRVSGISMVDPPLSGTDFTASENEDGTGASKTGNLTVTAVYGTAEVTYTLTAAADLWVQVLQARGKGVYTYDLIASVQEDSASQDAHGVIPMNIDLKYQPDATIAQSFGGYVVSTEAAAQIALDGVPIYANKNSMTMYGFLLGEPGTLAHVEETQTGVDDDYFITGYSFEVLPANQFRWIPVLKKDTGYFDFGTWDAGLWDSAVWG